MVEEMKANDASRYVVVAMDADSFKVLHVEESEGTAKEKATKAADSEEGRIIGVFQKIGTARVTRQVEWKGAAR